MREYNITKGALKDGETVLLGVRSILLEGESKWNNQTEKKRKDDCSAFLRILDSAEERVDALRDERFRTRAQEFLKQTRRSLFDGLPCGPVLAPK
jgi:2-keto-3-deoxy-galactonokinase